jgi:hypothetical protein
VWSFNVKKRFTALWRRGRGFRRGVLDFFEPVCVRSVRTRREAAREQICRADWEDAEKKSGVGVLRGVEAVKKKGLMKTDCGRCRGGWREALPKRELPAVRGRDGAAGGRAPGGGEAVPHEGKTGFGKLFEAEALHSRECFRETVSLEIGKVTVRRV